MNTYVLALCLGYAASDICNTMTDQPIPYDDLSDCQSEAAWQTKINAKGDEHWECLRFDGREIYTYVETTKR